MKRKKNETELNLLFSIEHNHFYVSRDAHWILYWLLLAIAGCSATEKLKQLAVVWLTASVS